MSQRPLSPHVFIYRFAYTMATSIFHRATGLALSAGLLLLIGFLASVASGPESYAAFSAVAASWPARVLWGLLVLCFCYHLANGVRHLLWDAGIGLERRAARLSAKVVVVMAVAATGLLLALLLRHGGAP